MQQMPGPAVLTVRCVRLVQGEISGRNSRGLSYRCRMLPGLVRVAGVGISVGAGRVVWGSAVVGAC